MQIRAGIAAAWMIVGLSTGCSSGGGATTTSTDACDAGAATCGAACVDLETDKNNCGQCGFACGASETCQDGLCCAGSSCHAYDGTDYTLSCPTGKTQCGSKCVDTQTDANNCGDCGKACPTGASCSAGTCACPTGQTTCDGACVDTKSDAKNCGGCGTACPTGEVCSNGACGCAGGKALCGGACIDTQNDVANCGGCGKACAMGQSCSGGACQCPTGQTMCNGTCVDTKADSANCGACGMACATGQSCCDGTCADTKLDGANCGMCANACSGGEACSGGTCSCGGVRPNLCGGTCTNLTADTNNCGACGTTCSGATPVCSNGSCVAACNTASGQTACGSQCVTLGNDPSNCGACGHACSASEICSGGTCTAVVSISPTGCADGTREFFSDPKLFPNLAGCAGGWDGKGGSAGYTGVFPAPLRSGVHSCATTGNSDTTNPNGTGCSSIDLCASGWHICAGGEVTPRASVTVASMGGTQYTGCDAQIYASYDATQMTTPWPAGSFFAAAIGSTGCYQCALTTGTLTGPSCTNASCQAGCQANPGLTNDIFGCGGSGPLAVSASVCDVNRSGNNVCSNLGAGWNCGSDGVRESVYAAHDPSAGGPIGGVLCCRDM